jgi:uncharacterized protein DUF559
MMRYSLANPKVPTVPFKISKKQLLSDYNTLGSLVAIARKYKRNVSIIRAVAKEYKIKTKYFKNYDLDLIKSLWEAGEPISRSKKQANCNSLPQEATRRGWKYKSRIFSRELTIELCHEILAEYSQGIKKAFIMDPNLTASVEFHTKDHLLESDKFTERVYRLINSFNPDQIQGCIHCKKQLKFYTVTKGYGESENQLCKKCIPCQKSAVSQRLFKILHSKLPTELQDKCHFSSLSEEKQVRVDVANLPLLNKNKYSLDFCLNFKNIEFDGAHWHKGREEKDIARDSYLTSKGYSILRIPEFEYRDKPSQVISKCLEFLTA